MVLRAGLDWPLFPAAARATLLWVGHGPARARGRGALFCQAVEGSGQTRAHPEHGMNTQKVFHMCWPLSNGSSKCIPIDEEPNYQIVHAFRLGKAQRATNQPLDPGPEIDVLALDFLRVLLAYVMLLWVDMMCQHYTGQEISLVFQACS